MHSPNSLVIETHRLSKAYKETQPLKNFNLTVQQHSIFGFLGPNGAGKTTAIKLLIGSGDWIFIPRMGLGTLLCFGWIVPGSDPREDRHTARTCYRPWPSRCRGRAVDQDVWLG